MSLPSDQRDTKFLMELASKAYWLVFWSHFLVFSVMVWRSITDSDYELPMVTWAIWTVIIFGTPYAYLSKRGESYTYRAWLTQALLLVSLAFGLANNGLGAITLFNLPFVAVVGAIFFTARVAFMQLGAAILIFSCFTTAKLSGLLDDTPNADWVLNSEYRWVLRTVYISLFSIVIIYFLERYIAFTFATVRDLAILKEAVDEAPDAFVVWDDEDRLFLSNRRYKNLDTRLTPFLQRGISFEETLRAGIQIGMYPQAKGREEDWIAERLAVHNQTESSQLVRLDDGRWMNIVESQTSSGYLAGFRTDVTALRNSENLLQATLDAVSEAVVTLSVDGRILNLNAASLHIFGYSLQELKGRHVTEIAPEESTTTLRKAVLTTALEQGLGSTNKSFDTVLRRKDGDKFMARVEVRDVEINGKRVFLTFITDLTRHRTFESTVQALGAAIEQLAAGFVLVNKANQVLYANNHFSQLLGLAGPKELVGLTVEALFDLIVGSDPELKISNNSLPIAGLRHFYDHSLRPVMLQMSDGSRLQLRRQHMEGSNSILTLIDTTDDHHRQMQLEQSTKLATLGEMAAGIAHELNQPLNAIKLTAATLLRLLEKDKNKAISLMSGKLEQISSQVDRAATITDHMRQSARMASEEGAVADLTQVVANAHLLVESGLRLESIEYRSELEAALPPCKIHPVKLEQVLLNLFSNARDAFLDRNIDRAHRWIRVSSEKSTPDTVTLLVEDSAGGISEDAITRIFDPFYTTKEVGKGTGLGLSISHGIVRDAGGTLSVTNTKKGARFKLVLPC